MNALLDALQYGMDSLDKPGRAVRGGLAGRPDELAAILPFSDTLGITDPSRRVSGEDLLRDAGLRTGSETGDWLAGMGVEMALDPTNLVGAGFLPRGVKALRGGRMAGETADEAINALKFAVEPGTEAFAKAPGDVLRRTAGLDVRPEVLPTLSQVPGGTGDEWELALRGNLASENMARRPGVDATMRFEDLPQFPDAPAARPRILPNYQDFAWKLGGYPDASAPSILTDMMADAAPRADIHRAALGNWDEALAALRGGLPTDYRHAVHDPVWQTALLNRLAELKAAERHGAMLGVGEDLMPALARQRDEVRRMLNVTPEDETGWLNAGVNEDRQEMFRNLNDMAAGGWHPSHLTPGRAGEMFPELLRDPILAPDLAVARRMAGHDAVNDAANYIRSYEGVVGDIDPADIESLRTNLLSGGRGQLAHDHPTLSPDAIRGALRTNPDLRETYNALLDAIRGHTGRPTRRVVYHPNDELAGMTDEEVVDDLLNAGLFADLD